MSDLELAEIARTVAFTMISDLYDSCGDSIYDYVYRPDEAGAFELTPLVENLSEKDLEDVKDLVRQYLISSYEFVINTPSAQPTLF